MLRAKIEMMKDKSAENLMIFRDLYFYKLLIVLWSTWFENSEYFLF